MMMSIADGVEGIQSAAGGRVLDGQRINAWGVDDDLRSVRWADDVAARRHRPLKIIGCRRRGRGQNTQRRVPAGDEVTLLIKSVTLHLRQRQIDRHFKPKIGHDQSVHNRYILPHGSHASIRKGKPHRYPPSRSARSPVHCSVYPPRTPRLRNSKVLADASRDHRWIVTSKPGANWCQIDDRINNDQVQIHR